MRLLKLKLGFFIVLAIALFAPLANADLPPAADTGTPEGNRTPGGTRPELAKDCKPTNRPLTALVPKNGNGLTTSEYPVFWFYIPYTPEDVHSVEFSLHDREEKTTLYRTNLQLTKTPGIIGISLPPKSENSLKVNQSYHWYLTVNCKPKKASSENDIVLDGWVKRVEQSSNLWYDELTTLANQYLADPQNPQLKNAWLEKLKSVGLEEIARVPLISLIQ